MPRQMPQRRQRNDEGVRQASEHVHGAVDEFDRKARRHHGGDDDGREIRDFEQQPANHGREGKVRADRKIDARVRMTRCWPSATIAITDVCARSADIRRLRNTGVVMLTTAIRITRIRMDPRLKSGGRAKSERRLSRARRSGRATPSPAILHPLSPYRVYY